MTSSTRHGTVALLVTVAALAWSIGVASASASSGSCLLQHNSKAARLESGASEARGTAPNTVGWDPDVLIGVRDLLEQDVPDWAAASVEWLERSAGAVVALPAGLRSGVGAGPWSAASQGPDPPSPGTPRDYHTIGVYLWPCNVPCPVETFGEEKCSSGAWEAGEKAHGACDQGTGLPWTSHDGFANQGNSDDLNAMVVMIDTLAKLTLAWFEYGAGIPGKYIGTAGALIAPTFRLNTRLSDCVELLKTASGVWTAADTASWNEWAQSWLDWMETSNFGKIQLNAVGNHATYLFLHKLAMARATGSDSVILDVVSKMRTDFGGSLGEQIVPTGEMPHETARIHAATYSRMNLNGLFQLGKAVENACRGLDCSPAWDWSWEVSDVSEAKWESFENEISKCSHRGSGSTASLDACKASCTEAAESCNAVVTRVKYGNLMGCYMKRCSGTNYQHQHTEPTANVYTSYHLVKGPPVGSGSVHKALDFLLPYALGEKDWKADFPQSTDADDSWRSIAAPLRIAAKAFGTPSYEQYISSVDPDGHFFRSFESLLFPPADALPPAPSA